MLIALDDEQSGEEGAPRVKLADFGVATLMSWQEEPLPEPALDPRFAARTPNLPKRPALSSSPGASSGASSEAEADTMNAQIPKSATATPSQNSQDPLTQTGILVGTPMYMAPELSEGSRYAQPPSDIFSLGVIAYELLTGEIPFSRPPVWARLRGTEVAVASLATKRPELSAALVAILDRCLSPEPSERPTAQAIEQALLNFPAQA